MKADPKFLHMPQEFWANVKLISQKLGYAKKHVVIVPTIGEIQAEYRRLGLDENVIVQNGSPTQLGVSLVDYFNFRANFLNNKVQGLLMNKSSAETLFNTLKSKLKPRCPLPLNKQKGTKAGYAFFTGIINMLVESASMGYSCNYNPLELPSFTKNNAPFRTLSRRVDGAFPSLVDPVAVWEIKEYYYTTTFGSRVADAVYETMLDGYELNEVRASTRQNFFHYLMVDDSNTWWNMGKSYLCRMCDILHMGLVTEILFGKEVQQRIPQIVPDWIKELNKRNPN